MDETDVLLKGVNWFVKNFGPAGLVIIALIVSIRKLIHRVNGLELDIWQREKGEITSRLLTLENIVRAQTRTLIRIGAWHPPNEVLIDKEHRS